MNANQIQPTQGPEEKKMTVPLIDKQENIPEYVDLYPAETIIEEINTYYSKYKYMEAQIVKHNEGIKVKIPDIEKAIEAVEYMEKKNKEEKKESENASLNIDFMVSNNLWAKADVPIGETVCLWLGADIMCEYSFDEAKTLLAKNLSNAQITLGNNETDLDYLKDQITVCEVNIARVYNEMVKRKNATAPKK